MNCTCQKAMLSRDGSMCCRCGGKGIMDLVAPGKRETAIPLAQFAETINDSNDSSKYLVRFDGNSAEVADALMRFDGGLMLPMTISGSANYSLNIPDLSEENLDRLIREWAVAWSLDGTSFPTVAASIAEFLHKKLTWKE